MAKLLEVFERIAPLLPEQPVLTAGGSAFFDRVAVAFQGRPVTAVLRSGCYVTQDGGHYDRVSPLGTARGGAPPHPMEILGALLSPAPPVAGRSATRWRSGAPCCRGPSRASL